ncbi:MAG: aspartate/tyrosine/aromatic aminotransferase [Rhodobacteraceae bacterium]|nr:aspartate/tyrosine/aromatic aminotransferase [Paracoccaceae bacterium]
MLDALTPQPADKILALMAAYKADTRTTKIDLGVGVYKNAEGVTPVMRAVKAAEQKIWKSQESKSYVGLAGDPAFSDAMIGLVLGDSVARSSVAAVATPGGTGAIRQGFELIKMGAPGATVWVSSPTWPNHNSILKFMGMSFRDYRYFDEETCAVDFDGMIADLGQVAEGDIVLLHGCCHNPTGANLNAVQWDEVIATLNAQKAIPMVDIAYQGFGDGLSSDGEAVRKVAAGCPETIIAASCSKNFGIYRERTGILMATGGADTPLTQATLSFLNRQNYSFPPDHGARIVTEILNDAALRADWEAELEEVREGMLKLRRDLADALQEETGSNRFGFVAEHRGMFSRLGLTPEQVEELREKHAVYMVGDSRINIAGLNAKTVPVLAKAIASVL